MGERPSVLVPLAEGFEEVEAVALIDVLRRADIEVVVASLGAEWVTGSHGIRVAADRRLGDVSPDELDAVVLPGGMPGTLALAESEPLLEVLRSLHATGRPTAALCAAPIVLERAGLLEGVSVTSHPSVRDRLGSAEVLGEPRVVKDGSVWTSQGPGTALEFALEIVAELRGRDVAEDLGRAMLVAVPASGA